jgi:hypothetical protein
LSSMGYFESGGNVILTLSFQYLDIVSFSLEVMSKSHTRVAKSKSIDKIEEGLKRH